VPSPRCDEQGLPRAFRTVRFTRSIQAVFSRPERPSPRPRKLESGLCSQAHDMGDAYQLAPSIAFFHLAVDEAWLHLPLAHVAPSTAQGEPLAKVGRESIKGESEPITRKEREAARGQALV
jgi:hypothetical protein